MGFTVQNVDTGGGNVHKVQKEGAMAVGGTRLEQLVTQVTAPLSDFLVRDFSLSLGHSLLLSTYVPVASNFMLASP